MVVEVVMRPPNDARILYVLVRGRKVVGRQALRCNFRVVFYHFLFISKRVRMSIYVNIMKVWISRQRHGYPKKSENCKHSQYIFSKLLSNLVYHKRVLMSSKLYKKVNKEKKNINIYIYITLY